MTIDLIFTDDGSCLKSNSFELLKMLSVRRYDGDLAADLVRNLGFISLRRQNNYFEITLRSQIVSQVALIAAVYWLADNPGTRIALRDLSNSSSIKMLPQSKQAIFTLLELVSQQALPHRCKEVVRNISDLAGQNQLLNLIELWRNGANEDILALEAYANQHLAGRFFVVSHGDVGLVFHNIGEGVAVPEKNWRAEALNTVVTNQPDQEYWHWAVRGQVKVLDSGAPFISDVESKIHWPESGWVYRKYRRILLPCIGANNIPALFSANCGDSFEVRQTA